MFFKGFEERGNGQGNGGENYEDIDGTYLEGEPILGTWARGAISPVKVKEQLFQCNKVVLVIKIVTDEGF